MTKDLIRSLISQMGVRRIVLDSVLKSEKRIWNNAGYRDIEEETVLTKDGIHIEEKTIEYGEFQKSQGGDVLRKEIKRYSLDESVDIIFQNRLYFERFRNGI